MKDIFGIVSQVPNKASINHSAKCDDEVFLNADFEFGQRRNSGGAVLSRKGSTKVLPSDDCKDVARAARLQALKKFTCYKKSVRQVITDRITDASFIPVHEWSAMQPQPAIKSTTHAADDAFFVADIGDTIRQYDQWRRLLPRVQPFFAMKCNPDPVIVSLLASLGCGFDCASKGEIEQALEAGVPAERIIYANPCKQLSHLQYAQRCGVTAMTFDNADELRKAHSIYGVEARMVLRIVTDDRDSVCKFSAKFGASYDAARELLLLAKELSVQIIGVSFHVGSGCCNPNAFSIAIKSAHELFEDARRLGFDMKLLDIGGGFPGSNSTYTKGLEFSDVAATIREAIDQFFDDSVTVIAEPGRYFVSNNFTLCVNVTSKRATVLDPAQPENREFMYYVNDGLYGSFNCIMFDHAEVIPRVLVRNRQLVFGEEFKIPCEAVDIRSDAETVSISSDEFGGFSSQPVSNKRYICSIWGPTCDSMDLIVKNVELPELQIGDWLYFESMGAYTTSAASQFNGFQKTPIIYTNTEPNLLAEYLH